MFAPSQPLHRRPNRGSAVTRLRCDNTAAHGAITVFCGACVTTNTPGGGGAVAASLNIHLHLGPRLKKE
jgi:hypothetical protein